MLYYERIDLSERIDLAKSNNSKECMICHYWFFNHGFKFQDSVCNGCCVFTIAIITIKNVDYRCIIHHISKSDAINLLENSVLENCGYISNNNYLTFSLFKIASFLLFVLVCIKWLIVWTSISF